jgi:tryptophan synthase alpha chain
MGRIQDLFAKKKKNVISIYCTAGYPRLDSTLGVIKALQDNGADMIELGMPYSDPLADGPVIQASSGKALANGMTVATLFQQLQEFRLSIRVPVLLMGYMNPVLQYGFDKFCAAAAAAGVDGLILPDLPIYEFETEYGPVIKKYGLDFIFLVTPETSPERIRRVDALGTAFLYAVSSSSTTGKNKDLEEQQAYFERLQQMGLQNPVLVGFSIRDKASFEAACRYTNGAIIGTAYIRALENAATAAAAGTGEGSGAAGDKGGDADIAGATKQFLSSILT